MDKAEALNTGTTMARVSLLELVQALKYMETAIHCTPTGPRREKYTEANIHLMHAASLLHSAFDTPLEADAKAQGHDNESYSVGRNESTNRT